MLTEFAPDVVFTHKMADLEILGALLDAGRPVVRMVHDHELCCMRGCKYSHFSRKICTRAAREHAIERRGARVPFRWVSYLAKRRELALNRRIDRLVAARALGAGQGERVAAAAEFRGGGEDVDLGATEGTHTFVQEEQSHRRN